MALPPAEKGWIPVHRHTYTGSLISRPTLIYSEPPIFNDYTAHRVDLEGLGALMGEKHYTAKLKLLF